MKKILCLLLCLLLLFCIGCQKEEEPNNDENGNNEVTTNEELGTLYTSGGNTYNTHIRVRLVTETLTAPVRTLTVEVQNDTDCRVNLLGQMVEWECEKWENGEWMPQPIAVSREVLYTDSVLPKSKGTWSMTYAGDLYEGVYRLQRTVNVSPTAQKSFECITETYFTILPAPVE